MVVDVESPWKHAISEAIRESLKSPCRSKRGAAIWRPGAPDNWCAVGYNELVGEACDGSAACKATCSRRALHAEQAAILVLARSPYTSIKHTEMLHVKTVDGALVPSGEPSCVECSKLILASGIESMWLYHADGWNRYSALEFHHLSLWANR